MSKGLGDPSAPTRTADAGATSDSAVNPTESGADAAESSRDATRQRLPAPLQYRDRERYDVAGEHGRGGLGRVLRARDRELGRTVAIKELLKPGPVGELRFFREALITARLEHPSIVPVHEAGRWPDGTPFYTMKLVAGRPLRELIAGAATRSDVLALVRHVVAVGDAVSYAHAHGIVHRDIKPSNVLIGDYGETVVIDWGLAKGLDQSPDPGEPESEETPPSTSELTVAGAVLGTPAFMSPEQAKGLPVDFTTDVYALGMVLREILAVRASRGSSRFLLGSWERAELVSIAALATAPEPGARYESMAAFADDLRRYLNTQLVKAHNYSALQRLRRYSRAHPVLTAAFIVGLAASAIIATGFSAVLAREQQRTLSANEQLASTLVKLQDNQQDLILQQAKTFLDSDPTSTLAWLKLYRGPLIYKAQEYAASALARGVGTAVMPHPGSPVDAAWLDDDASVAVVTLASGSLVRWSPPGASTDISKDLDEGLLSAISTSTRVVVFGTRGGELRLYDDSTGAQRTLHPVKPPVLAIHISTNGRMLLAADSGSTLLLGDPAGPLEIVPIPVAINRAVPSPTYDTAIVCGADGSLFLYRHKTRRLIPVDFACSSQNEVPLVYAPDGTTAIVVGPRTLGRLDTATGRISDAGELSNVAFGEVASDTDAAIMTIDGEIHRVPFDSRPSRLVFSSETPFSSVFRHEGATPALLIGAADGSALRFDLKSNNVVRHDVHPRAIASVAVDGAGKRALTTDVRETRVWRIPVAQSWRMPSRASFRAVYGPDGKTVFTDSQDGSVFEVDAITGAVTRHAGHAGIAFGVKVDSDGSVLSAGWDGTLRRWRDGAGVVVAKHGSQVRHFTTTSAAIITIDEKVVRFTDRETSLVRTIPFPESPFRVAASETRTMVLTSQGGVFLLEDSGPRKLGGHGTGRGDIVYVAALDLFASTGRDGRIAIWSPAGDLVQEHRIATTCGVLAASPEGRVAGLCNRNVVALIDVKRSAIQFKRETTPEVYNVAFSPKGDYLAVSFVAGEAYFWKVQDLSLAAAAGGRGTLTAIQFSPDGKQALATSFSGRVFVWNLDDMQFVPPSAGWFLHATNVSLDALQHRVRESDVPRRN